MKQALADFLQRAWYGDSALGALLGPLGQGFEWLVERRRRRYRSEADNVYRAPVPVIVVGNITLGGTGKTPMVIALVELLRSWGYQPGVVSRGYASEGLHYPFDATREQPPGLGDEVRMITERCSCPLVVDPDRGAAARALLRDYRCDVLISDDGLQHYALARDLEIVMVDAMRGFGNGRCLPAGPLREPLSRLAEVNWLIVNAGSQQDGSAGQRIEAELEAVTPSAKAALNDHVFVMQLVPQGLRALSQADSSGDSAVAHMPSPGMLVDALAGIGNPQRFFNSLAMMGFEVREHAFADHHRYQAKDFTFRRSQTPPRPLIMTEKDAVKCRELNLPDAWYLPVDASLDPDFVVQLQQVLRRLQQAADETTNREDP